MAERLTWEEIVARDPDEWVIVVDIDDDPRRPKSGRPELSFIALTEMRQTLLP